MALAKWQRDITDAEGNLQPGTTVKVRREATGALEPIYADRDGTTPLANPFTDADGKVVFYCAGGAFRVILDEALSTERDLRYEPVGTAAEADLNTLAAAGFSYTFEAETSAPPSASSIRADNADLTAATTLWIADETVGGSDLSARWQALAAETKAYPDQVELIDPNSGEAFVADVSAVSDEDGYTALTIANGTGATTLPVGGVKAGWRFGGPTGREILTGNRTYYVDEGSGSDSNDGLSSGAGAFATIQKAVDVAQAIDPGVYAITISVADGTYAENVTLTGPLIGGGRLTITGNTGTPANVLIQPASGNVVIVKDGAVLDLRGVKIVANSGLSLYITNYSKVYYRSVDFGASSSNHISVNTSACVCEGNYDITGGANHHIDMGGVAFFQCNGKTVTLTGTPAFTRFIRVTASNAVMTGNTFTGAATGSRYLVQHNGSLNSGGAGPTHFPGSTAGSTPTGGQYI